MLVQLNLIYSEVSPYTCPELIMVPLATNSSEGGSPVTITRLVSTVHIVAEVGVRVWDAADTWHVTRGTWQLVRCVTDQQGTFVCGARLPQIMHKAGGASRRHCSTAALRTRSTRISRVLRVNCTTQEWRTRVYNPPPDNSTALRNCRVLHLIEDSYLCI